MLRGTVRVGSLVPASSPQAGSPELIAARRVREERIRHEKGDAPYEVAFRAGRGSGIEDGIAYTLRPHRS